MQYQAWSLGGWCATRHAALSRRCHFRARFRRAWGVELRPAGVDSLGGVPRTTVSQYLVAFCSRLTTPRQYLMLRASACALAFSCWAVGPTVGSICPFS